MLQFVGFLGTRHTPGDLPPLAAATLCALLTVWATFIPGYLFIFAGAPFIERTRRIPQLESALSTVTAAVVGVIIRSSEMVEQWRDGLSQTARPVGCPHLKRHPPLHR